MLTDVTVFGVTYNIARAPTWVRFGVNLWVRRFSTNYFDVGRIPTAVRFYVNQLCTRFGVQQ